MKIYNFLAELLSNYRYINCDGDFHADVALYNQAIMSGTTSLEKDHSIFNVLLAYNFPFISFHNLTTSGTKIKKKWMRKGEKKRTLLFKTLWVVYLCSLPEPGKMFITPFGMPAFTDSSANFRAVNGVTCR